VLIYECMKKVIIFDYDGVIVDSLDVYEKAVISAFQKNNCNQITSRKSFLDLFDGNFFESAVKIGIPRERIPAILRELELNLQSLQIKLKLFAGIPQVLSELAKKCKIYIVTSNLTGVVKTYLESQKIMTIEEIIGADKEVSKIKKIEYIKSKFPNGKFLYVGDTKGDMIEGKKAGVKTVAVSWGWHSVSKLKEGNPDFIVKRLNELLSLVNDLR